MSIIQPKLLALAAAAAIISSPALAQQSKDTLRFGLYQPIKILDRTENLLAPHGKNVDDSKAILREHGNMSSATVLFILARVFERDHEAGDRGLMLSFGPGFMGHTLLLEWR